MMSIYSYMFKHVGLVFLSLSRLPDDGTPVPKHVGADIHHELYFMMRILLYLFSAYIGWYIEPKAKWSMKSLLSNGNNYKYRHFGP
jgi:hypothetical protein